MTLSAITQSARRALQAMGRAASNLLAAPSCCTSCKVDCRQGRNCPLLRPGLQAKALPAAPKLTQRNTPMATRPAPLAVRPWSVRVVFADGSRIQYRSISADRLGAVEHALDRLRQVHQHRADKMGEQMSISVRPYPLQADAAANASSQQVAA